MAPFYINYFVSGEAVEFGICPRRLVGLTTDGASTMVATGRELNFPLHQLCLGNFVTGCETRVGTCGCKGNGEGFELLVHFIYGAVHGLKVHKHEIFLNTFFAETETIWPQGPVTRDF